NEFLDKIGYQESYNRFPMEYCKKGGYDKIIERDYDLVEAG
ncbi:2006_t:CDS:1, partial [Rhizophagus irregularis]